MEKEARELAIVARITDNFRLRVACGASPPPSMLYAGPLPGKEVNAMGTRKIGRSAVTGRYTTVKTAESKPSNSCR